MESRTTRFEAHLIDGVLALDAGSLTRTLTFKEQAQVRVILLSHRHFDHVRDLLPLGLALHDRGGTVDVYGIQDTIDFVSTRLLDGSLYPDLVRIPNSENPVVHLHTIDYLQPFQILDYAVTAVPVPHSGPQPVTSYPRRAARSFTLVTPAGDWRAPGSTYPLALCSLR